MAPDRTLRHAVRRLELLATLAADPLAETGEVDVAIATWLAGEGLFAMPEDAGRPDAVIPGWVGRPGPAAALVARLLPGWTLGDWSLSTRLSGVDLYPPGGLGPGDEPIVGYGPTVPRRILAAAFTALLMQARRRADTIALFAGQPTHPDRRASA